MRHARSAWPARAKVGLSSLALTLSAVAGFAWGANVTATHSEPGGDVVAVEPMSAPEASPIPAEGDADAVGPVDSIPLPEPALQPTPDPTLEPIIGEDMLEPEWPVDIRGDGCTSPVWPA